MSITDEKQRASDPLSQIVREAVRQAIEEAACMQRPRLMNVAAAAEYLGLDESSVRRMVAARRLQKVGIFERKQMFDVRDLDALIEERKTY
jgi:hypothetical protein